MKIERTEKYIELTSLPFADYLEEIKEAAVSEGIPIIRPSVQSLLRFLMKTKNPQSILEIGSAVGFSALLMHEYGNGSEITTIENYAPRIKKAKENFAKYASDVYEDDGSGSLKLLEGDAEKILPDLKSDTYDFIFLDAAKGQYIVMLPEIVRLLKKGGMLFSDNVLQDGDIIEPKAFVRRRDRTIYERMREYLSCISSHEELESAILPMADGVTVSVKK